MGKGGEVEGRGRGRRAEICISSLLECFLSKITMRMENQDRREVVLLCFRLRERKDDDHEVCGEAVLNRIIHNHG